MKITVKPDQDLPLGPLGPAAFTIPEIWDFPENPTETERQKHLGLEASKI